MTRLLPLLSVLLAAGCSAGLPGYPVAPPLPPEAIPLPPLSEEQLTWQPSDWAYVGGSYRLQPGGYVPAAGHGGSWVFGHWAGVRPNYAWIPGGWAN